ncbi:host cell division inhibitor Icd-like protein [Yersinia sp. KBS0713]|nr:host cell division inhibitor Icd-like protein [Yersinia sp. KBS0713]
MRAVKDCDFAFFEPVAICCSHVFWCKTVYTVNILFKDLTCKTPCNYIVSYTLPSSWCENSNAPECGNTSEASNHNVNEAYTMALQHSTQTRPKFQYLFLAVCRSDLNATPHRESVTAHSEQDARRSLSGQFVLSFAGRIPAQGVYNA